MLSCGSKENGFATYQCLGCGKGERKVNSIRDLWAWLSRV
jgi:hypothetical protein